MFFSGTCPRWALPSTSLPQSRGVRTGPGVQPREEFDGTFSSLFPLWDGMALRATIALPQIS